MSGEGMIANDPVQFVRWEPAMDQRVRPFHGMVPPLGHVFWDLPLPRSPFDRNFRCVLVPIRPPPELPEGLWDRDGVVFFTCLGCGNSTDLHCEPEEFDPDVAYCGGSPRCLS